MAEDEETPIDESRYAKVYVDPDNGDAVLKRSNLFWCRPRQSMYEVYASCEAIGEVAALTRLQSCETPHIVPVYGVRIDPQKHTLTLAMRRLQPLCVPQPLERVSKYTRDIMEGLYGMNLAGVVHRDIKIDNLMYDPESDGVRFIDFGLSGLDVPTRVRADFGVYYTVWYRPPELLLGCTEYDTEKAEVWSVGVCVASMITGRRYVFRGQTEYEVLSSIIGGLGGYSQSWESMPRWPLFYEQFDGTERYWGGEGAGTLFSMIADGLARDFVSRCLTPNPAKRPTIKELLHHPFADGRELGLAPPFEMIQHHRVDAQLGVVYRMLPHICGIQGADAVAMQPSWLYAAERLLMTAEHRSIPMMTAGLALSAIAQNSKFIKLGEVATPGTYCTVPACEMVEELMEYPLAFQILSACYAII